MPLLFRRKKMLEKVRKALRIVTTDFDDELQNLIDAALLDLGITDIRADVLETPDALVSQAVITYCKINFGEPDEYERLRASYWEQKAQLLMSSKYTSWGDVNG